MSEDEANKVREQNENIRKQRDDTADKIATKFSLFKRDFLSAPIRSAMYAITKGGSLPKSS
jgi:hypothetical protein